MYLSTRSVALPSTLDHPPPTFPASTSATQTAPHLAIVYLVPFSRELFHARILVLNTFWLSISAESFIVQLLAVMQWNDIILQIISGLAARPLITLERALLSRKVQDIMCVLSTPIGNVTTIFRTEKYPLVGVADDAREDWFGGGGVGRPAITHKRY